jgi:hypothetical protein
MADLAANPVFTDPEWNDLNRDQVRIWVIGRKEGKEGEVPLVSLPCGRSASLDRPLPFPFPHRLDP